jgi:hypothetical protein
VHVLRLVNCHWFFLTFTENTYMQTEPKNKTPYVMSKARKPAAPLPEIDMMLEDGRNNEHKENVGRLLSFNLVSVYLTQSLSLQPVTDSKKLQEQAAYEEAYWARELKTFEEVFLESLPKERRRSQCRPSSSLDTSR